MLTTTSTFQAHAFSSSSLLPRFQRRPPPPSRITTAPSLLTTTGRHRLRVVSSVAAAEKESIIDLEVEEEGRGGERWKKEIENRGAKMEDEERGETFLYSIAPYPLLFAAAALPGAGTVRSIFGPFVELVKTLNLPDWLVHWGHPGNMAVVLFAMGGYGSYLGFRIRLSNDAEEKAMAKELHPKLLGGMFFFFALGATGGVTSLLTSGKPILESPHAVTGLIGLSLLTVQTILPALFEGSPGLRPVHGLLGSSIMTLFLIHSALGLQLGLSF